MIDERLFIEQIVDTHRQFERAEPSGRLQIHKGKGRDAVEGVAQGRTVILDIAVRGALMAKIRRQRPVGGWTIANAGVGPPLGVARKFGKTELSTQTDELPGPLNQRRIGINRQPVDQDIFG